MQLPQRIDQNTSSMGFPEIIPANLNFWPLIFDRTTPSSDEIVPGLESGMNNDINGNVSIAIKSRIDWFLFIAFTR